MATRNRSQLQDTREAAGLSHRSSSYEGQGTCHRASSRCKNLDPDGIRTHPGTASERKHGRTTGCGTTCSGFVDSIRHRGSERERIPAHDLVAEAICDLGQRRGYCGILAEAAARISVYWKFALRTSKKRTTTLLQRAACMLATPLFLPAQELRAVSPLENQANGSLAVSEVVANLVAGNAERAKALQSYTGRRTYRLDYHGLPGNLRSEMVVKVIYRAPSTKKFTVISEKGSKLIINRVFFSQVIGERGGGAQCYKSPGDRQFLDAFQQSHYNHGAVRRQCGAEHRLRQLRTQRIASHRGRHTLSFLCSKDVRNG